MAEQLIAARNDRGLPIIRGPRMGEIMPFLTQEIDGEPRTVAFVDTPSTRRMLARVGATPVPAPTDAVPIQ